MDAPAFRTTAVTIDADLTLDNGNSTMKSAQQSISLTAVVIPEVVGGQSKYVAMGVEYDICVQASSVRELKERMHKTLRGHLFISQQCGVKPFECVAVGKAEPAREWGTTEKVADGLHNLTLQIA
jgi:hypothetical protein